MTPNATTALTLTSIAAMAAAGTLVLAALSARSQLFGPILIAGCDPNHLALTFDDGPNPAATPQLLDLLAAHNVRATFFLIGRYVRQQPALTRQIAAAGHTIGNHTMTHPWLAWQTAARIRSEIADCSAAIQDIIAAPINLFRPPHGARRPYVLAVARDLGLTPVNWNIIIQDWKPTDPATLLTRIERGIGRNRRAGCASNLLLHDGDGSRGLGADRRATVEATRRLLVLLQDRPLSYVTPDRWKL